MLLDGIYQSEIAKKFNVGQSTIGQSTIGRIKRNEVYFDRTELVSEIYSLKKEHNCM